ncbi:uncharacterized protein LOC131434090 [Malaya genurostris]|uniref:uncharacterized protein LOC131434090 n=1 Tax=Malaya genurostris TaxID=325434 RepID=UPI0026F3E083|nr:uncharacterized protein LOC131434090 [Malaya genurostris]
MNSTRECGKCNTGGVVNEMVGCDMCDIWLHADCAGITGDTPDPNRSWRCAECLHDEVTDVVSIGSRKTAKTSSSTRNRRAELALKLLEDEQALREINRQKEDELRKKEAEILKTRAEEDAKLLKQKHDLLQSLEDEDNSNMSGISSRASREMVQSWLGGGEIPPPEKPQPSVGDVQPIVTSTFGTVSTHKSTMSGPQFGTDSHPTAIAATNIDVPKSSSTPHTMISSVFDPKISISQRNQTVQSFLQGSRKLRGASFSTKYRTLLNITTVSQNVSSHNNIIPLASKFSQVFPTVSQNSFLSNLKDLSIGHTVPVNTTRSHFVSAPSLGNAMNVVQTYSQPTSSVPYFNQWSHFQHVPKVSFTSVPATTTVLGQAHSAEQLTCQGNALTYTQPTSSTSYSNQFNHYQYEPNALFASVPLATTPFGATHPEAQLVCQANVPTYTQPISSVSYAKPWNHSQYDPKVSFRSVPVTTTPLGQTLLTSQWDCRGHTDGVPTNVYDSRSQQHTIPSDTQQTNASFQTVPSGAQIVARQGIPRDLPTFSGDPQDWPIFSSTFYNSTAACGYTDVENLARLQRCLKGSALEAVKSRLLLPQSVSFVMDTLKMLYGRPEILLHSLLQKLRSVSSPRTENLQSIIVYGMAVRNLVDHMRVANLEDHMRNPMLVQELVEKLPPQMRMQWSCFKRTYTDVDLSTFGEFMSELVKTATDVSIPGELIVQQTRSINKGREKQKLYVHTEAESKKQKSTNTKSPNESDPTRRQCAYCSEDGHEIALCPQFKALDLDGRWKAIRSKGLCRMCLIPHRKWPCRSGKECGVDGCRIHHNSLLHSQRAVTETLGGQPKYVENVTRQNHHAVSNFSLFRYLPVTLEGNGKKLNTFAFLDDGCESTLLEAGLAKELNIVGPEEPLCLSWTGDISREEKGSQRVSVTISGVGLKSKFQLSNVRTVQKLMLQSQSFHYDELKRIYPHLEGLPLSSYSDAVPRMIIGIEHAQMITTLKVREGRSTDPIAAKTRLGWCVYVGQSILSLHMHSQANDYRELHELMKQYYSIEEAAVATPLESEEDRRARAILEKTTQRVDGGFETGLLWKYDRPSFPNSYPLALRRMYSLEKRLAKEPELQQRVNTLLTEYESKGYAHRITQEELNMTKPERVWYLPIGIVRNPKKPDKIRLIWDAAARVHGVSLNDMLLKGPDMLASLFAVLLRFRQRSVAVCGDIREMFHQIRIVSQDKQSQRFVYRENPDQLPQIYVMDVATFGATCSPCSAQFVKNKNAQEFASKFPRAAEAIEKAHYVDDFLDSVDTVEEAVRLVKDVKYVHDQGGFDIRNFLSNSADVLQGLGETQSTQVTSVTLSRMADMDRVLGVIWIPATDVFAYDIVLKDDLVKLLTEGITPTKRQVLRLVMSLFDPYGLIAHFTIHGKILMQHIWRSGSDWDEKIVEGLQGLWNSWIMLLKRLNEVRVPRCFFGEASSGLPSAIQLHVFVDAGELAYACVAYLRIIQDGTVRCALVAAKTKVAPLKPLSIPRLELQAGLIGVRLMDNICAVLDLPLEKRYVWTDSRTILSWIKSDSRRYHSFVGFRVGEILNISSMDEWRYVPSKLNVADDATKWGSGPSFSPNSRWYSGPTFLYLSETQWPDQPTIIEATKEELRVAFQYHQQITPALVDVSRFSNWNRLVRTMAYVFRAIGLFRKKSRPGPLTSGELRQAENVLWRQAQIQAFPDDFCVLHFNKTNPDEQPKRIEKCSPLFKQSPFIDDAGVIRMDSRICAAPTIPYAAKYPILLPRDHKLTTLLVEEYHRRFKHQNHETVLNEIWQQFRIPKLRPLLKRIVRNCVHCKVRKAVPKPAMMACLPKVRLTPHIRAFSHTGIDYFGPIQIRQGRSLVKRWVSLFTCLTTRAIHLELVHSLSTQFCVMAIRRFVARRGSPSDFYSDNGTCFRGASNLLVEQIRAIHDDCAVTFTNARTNWHFNPPSAPHMGGAWERMVRSVKAAMQTISEHPRYPNDEVLETVMLGAEAIVNSRPLTYIPLENADQEALTPNHFLLYGPSGIGQPTTPLMSSGHALRDSWKLAQNLVDMFWKRWVREYLPMLTRRTKWFEYVQPLEPGNLVMSPSSSSQHKMGDIELRSERKLCFRKNIKSAVKPLCYL